MIYKLTVKDYPYNSAAYFRTKEAMEQYKYVFKNHWCNIPWDKPEELPDDYKLPSWWREHIDDDPKKLAEDNLCWGFNSVMAYFGERNKLNKEQQAFVNNMIGQFTS